MARKAALGHRTGTEAAGFAGERVSHLPVCSKGKAVSPLQQGGRQVSFTRLYKLSV